MMKKLVAMMMCLLLVLSGLTAVAETTLDVAYTFDYPMYNTVDGQGEFSGFNVELLQAVADMDEEFTIGQQSIATLGDALMLKSISCNTFSFCLVLPLYRTWETDVYKDYNYSARPYLSFAVAAVVKAHSGITSFADLADKNVAFEGDISGNLESYNAAHPDAPLACNVVELREGYYYPLDMLDSGEADAAIVNMISASDAVNRSEGQYVMIEIPEADQLSCTRVWMGCDVHFLETEEDAAAKIPPVLERIGADLDALVADGTYGQLCEKYFGVDLTPLYTFGEAVPEASQGENTDTEEITEASGEEEDGETAEEPPKVYTDKDTVKKVQQALNDAGFNCGTPDGLAGKKTNQAIIDFKAANGLDDATADITDALLAALGIG